MSADKLLFPSSGDSIMVKTTDDPNARGASADRAYRDALKNAELPVNEAAAKSAFDARRQAAAEHSQFIDDALAGNLSERIVHGVLIGAAVWGAYRVITKGRK